MQQHNMSRCSHTHTHTQTHTEYTHTHQVERTIFSNTAGTAPAAGVDLEPDFPYEDMINISFLDCASVGNAGGGFQVYLGTYVN